MSKIVKSFKSNLTDYEIQHVGVICFCSWNRMKEYLNQACTIKPDEEIVGIIVDENGINIKIKNIN